MKKFNGMILFIIALSLVMFSSVAFAQDVSELDFITQILSWVKELKGASTLVILGTLIQAIILFSRTSWSSMLGKSKLLIVSVLSFIGIFVTGYAQGLELSTMITDGATLTAFQVLINQVFKQVQKKD